LLATRTAKSSGNKIGPN